MNKTILIRADASTPIGTGHIMRCLTLANALHAKGYRIIFLTKKLSGNINHKINLDRFEVRNIISNSINDEIPEVTSIIKEESASLIIFDHYGIDNVYEKNIYQQSGIQIFSFDDTFEKHHCDILLNQNIYAYEEAYLELVPASCKLLCGTEFALIRDEFKQAQKRQRENAFPQNIHLLLTFGGSDADNMTLDMLHILEEITNYTFIADVVVGASNPHFEQLKEFVLTSRHSMSIHANVSNMAELMNRADIAISACGSTTIELLYMAVPSLLLILSENQQRIGDYMHTHNLALSLDARASLDQLRIRSFISELIENTQLRCTFVQNMQDHSVGNINKLIKIIKCTLLKSYTMRHATLSDLMPVLELSNTPYVRANSINSKSITLHEHSAWFTARLKQTDSPYFIIEHHGTFLGQLRLDKTEDGYIVSISLMNHLQGCGYAKEIVRKALDILPKGSKVLAYIKPSNLASLAIFEKNGFALAETTFLNNIPTHKLIKEITA